MTTTSHRIRRGAAALTAAALCGFLAVPPAHATTGGEPVTVALAAQDATSSTLTWGVRESFRSYIQGPIANGGWTVDGVQDNNGQFTWNSGFGTVDDEELSGTIGFSGGVHFTGHEGHFEEGEPALSVELENPTIEFSGSTGTLYADIESVNLQQESVGGEQIALADLELSNGVVIEGDTLSGEAEVFLTEEGSEAFASFYAAGEQLDSLNFTSALVPVESAEPTPTETAEPTPTETEAPSESPSPTGSSSPSPTSSPSSTATSSPTQTSTSSPSPTQTQTQTQTSSPSSSASSSASPEQTTAPSSTAAAAETAEEEPEETFTETVCLANEISGASLNWGLRESFRSYIQGGIARGDWTLNGTTYSGGSYQWGGGSGTFNTESGTGSATFSGGIHFTGHDGVLNFQLSNPRIAVTGSNSAVLYVDAVSDDLDGNTHNLPGVAFANISGPISTSGGSVSASGAQTALTSEGATAFAGFYEAGESLDPISFTLPLGAETDCEEIEVDAQGNPIAGGAGSNGGLSSGGGGQLASTGTTLAGFGALSLLLLIAGGALTMALRRRREQH